MKQTKQLKYWQGEFGNAYVKRNSDLKIFDKRNKFFTSLLKEYSDIKSILEVGCSIGGNLHVLNKINKSLILAGIEPNQTASDTAQKLVPTASIFTTNIYDFERINSYDLVFTSGVLIHIANKNLKKALLKMRAASRRYLLSIEYYSRRREVVPYRNLKDALFKRPYDKEWRGFFSFLKLVKKGFIDKTQGFDNCHWWLFQKTEL